MPRTVSLLVGVLTAAAVTYKLRDNLSSDTSDIRRRLHDAKTTLDQVAAGTASSKPLDSPTARSSFISDSQKYVSGRLVPSGNELNILSCLSLA